MTLSLEFKEGHNALLMSWIWLPHTTAAHHPWTTSPIMHTHIPVHHYTNHTAVTIHSLVLIASPHLHLILTLTFKQHSHLRSLRSLVLPWLHFWAFSLVCTTWTIDSLSWLFAACLTDPACLLVILSVCCLPWSIALPLFMYLSYLRCPRYHYLIFACLTSSLYQ